MNSKRYFATLYALFGLMFLLAASSVFAQTIQKGAKITWKLPVTATDGSALTGQQALTKVQLFVSTSPIPAGATPTAELGPGVTTTNQTVTVPVGGKIYAAVAACNILGCSAIVSAPPLDVVGSVPGLPTEVTITIIVTP